MERCLECGHDEFYWSHYTEDGYIVETNKYCNNCDAFIAGDSYGYRTSQEDDLEEESLDV